MISPVFVSSPNYVRTKYKRRMQYTLNSVLLYTPEYEHSSTLYTRVAKAVNVLRCCAALVHICIVEIRGQYQP